MQKIYNLKMKILKMNLLLRVSKTKKEKKKENINRLLYLLVVSS
jgi:hypothetical protein